MAKLARTREDCGATIDGVVSSAPRYDPRIRDALHALDDRREPIAELGRQVGALAEVLGLTRPSYVHLRRIVVAEREREDAERRRREQIRGIALDVVEGVYRGVRVDTYEVAERVRDAGGL